VPFSTSPCATLIQLAFCLTSVLEQGDTFAWLLHLSNPNQPPRALLFHLSALQETSCIFAAPLVPSLSHQYFSRTPHLWAFLLTQIFPVTRNHREIPNNDYRTIKWKADFTPDFYVQHNGATRLQQAKREFLNHWKSWGSDRWRSPKSLRMVVLENDVAPYRNYKELIC